MEDDDITLKLRELMVLDIREFNSREIKTPLEAVCVSLIREAGSGDFNSIKLLLERVEGRATVKTEKVERNELADKLMEALK